MVLADDASMVEGAYRIDVGPQRITISGGPFSGVIQGTEALLRLGKVGCGALSVPAGRFERAPALAHRVFWTWDHSTHWDVDTVGLQETGAFNPYGKQPDEFVSDYQRMIDFMSRHGVGGV